ncbi:hypothetical protein PG994_007856 [Apiospora phragmitis]|uniref:Uncharacterized protein n=1 Tax=Apiospora phragmitis TaxID=2905665 RepID=A0ABR1UTX6_9PEZI
MGDSADNAMKKAQMKAKKVLTHCPRLPPEIWATIFDMFLEDEGNEREFVIHDDKPCLLPDIRLVSPLLSLNTQSRDAALKHYSTKLTVYDIYQEGEVFSFFPMGHLYVNLKKMGDGVIRLIDRVDHVLHIDPDHMHFQQTFTDGYHYCAFLGSLTERLPDGLLPIEGLPHYYE